MSEAAGAGSYIHIQYACDVTDKQSVRVCTGVGGLSDGVRQTL